MTNAHRYVILGCLASSLFGCDADQDVVGASAEPAAIKIERTSAFALADDPLVGLGPGIARRVLQAHGGGDEEIAAVAHIPAGDLIVAGTFAGELAIGAMSQQASGERDAFVARVSPSRGVLWVRMLGGAGARTVKRIAPTADAIYIAGTYAGGFNVETSPSTEMLSLEGMERASYVMKLDLDGAPQWATRIGQDEGDEIGGIAATPQGDVVVAGRFARALSLGSLSVSGDEDVFLGKIAAAGEVSWLRKLSGVGVGDAAGVAVAPDGGVIVAMTECQATFAPSCRAEVRRRSADGAEEWTARTSGPGRAEVRGITMGPGGSVVVVGDLMGQATFVGADGLRPVALTSDGTDVFVARLSLDGALRSANAYGGAGEQRAFAVAADEHRTVVAGSFEGATTFAGRPYAAQGGTDAFALFLNADDAVAGANMRGGAGNDAAQAASLAGGRLALAGVFEGTVDFGSATAGDERQARGADGFVVW